MFLISRIYEYRTLPDGRAHTTEAAVVKGLEKTGSTITTAGIISECARARHALALALSLCPVLR